MGWFNRLLRALAATKPKPSRKIQAGSLAPAGQIRSTGKARVDNIDVDIVGESFDNRDGTSRQAELRRCEALETASVTRERDNPVSQDAVAVFSARGVQIGYIGKSRSVTIGEALDDGRVESCIISSVGKGSSGLLGATLLIRIRRRTASLS